MLYQEETNLFVSQLVNSPATLLGWAEGNADLDLGALVALGVLIMAALYFGRFTMRLYDRLRRDPVADARRRLAYAEQQISVAAETRDSAEAQLLTVEADARTPSVPIRERMLEADFQTGARNPRKGRGLGALFSANPRRAASKSILGKSRAAWSFERQSHPEKQVYTPVQSGRLPPSEASRKAKRIASPPQGRKARRELALHGEIVDTTV